jgi:Tfp pilus assembly protein PilN
VTLQVNLIRDEERRSAAMVYLRQAARAVGALLVLAILLLVLVMGVRLRNVRASADEARARWKKLEPDFVRVQQLRSGRNAAAQVDQDLRAFTNAQLRFAARLEAIGRLVPANVQLTELRLTQQEVLQPADKTRPAAGKTTQRVYELRLVGRTGGPQARESVSRLIESLRSDAVFSGTVEKVSSTSFRQDPAPGAARDDRIFEIGCRFKPRRFE